MTDQPKQSDDGTPQGYGPPPHIPSQDPYGQPESPYGTAYPAPTQQPYGAPGQPYGQPGSPYNAYGQPGYYGVPPAPRSLSIASLCCGIAVFLGFGFFILPQIAAVILGHLALTREPAGKGMAIAGLVLGYVGIAITVLVIVIFSLAMGSARYRGYGA